MNRELRFRAWDSDKKIMYYSDKNQTVWVGGLQVSVNTDEKQIFSCDTAMMYTGMKDKEGIDLYEGDITYEGVIYWDDKYLGFFTKKEDREEEILPLYDFPLVEKLGDIYSNPELLNTK